MALGYFEAFLAQFFPNTESVSHNVVLRKGRKYSSDIFIGSKRQNQACSLCELWGFFSIPDLLVDERESQWILLNLIYIEFIEFAGHAQTTPTAVRRT